MYGLCSVHPCSSKIGQSASDHPHHLMTSLLSCFILDHSNHLLQRVICSRGSQRCMCKVNRVGYVTFVQEGPADESAEVPLYILDVYLNDFLEWMIS